MLRTNIAIVRDTSGSMAHLRHGALADYNDLLAELKRNAIGVNTVIVIDFDSSVAARAPDLLENIRPDSEYYTGGNTALYDAVTKAIELLTPYDTYDSANLVMVITDGQENVSKTSPHQLANSIRNLQNTDRWTFTFRVPLGYKKYLSTVLCLQSGNVLEWSQTDKGIKESSDATMSGVKQYYAARSTGKTSVNNFYAANPADVASQVSAKLDDLSGQYKRYVIGHHQDGISIQDFCIEKIGVYKLGHVYYSLNKQERVQPNKDIIIRDSVSGSMYGGQDARKLLGLPYTGEIKLAPGNMGQYEVFIRSTSNNRKLYANNAVLVRNK